MPKILLLIFLLSLFILPLAEAGLLAGASRVKITPSYSVYLAGLGNNRKSEGVHDDIYASALYLNDGKTSVVIVSLDLIGLFHDDVEDIRGNKNDIIIACTHQHSGPDTLGLWGPDETTSGVNPEYLAFVKGKVREAIDKAR